MPLINAARKAAISVVSDFASKGVAVSGMVFSLSLPPIYDKDDIRDIARGLKKASGEYGFRVLAADTNESQDMSITCTGIGFSTYDIPTRGGASPGDAVVTTGLFGLTPLGLYLAKRDMRPQGDVEDRAYRAFLSPVVQIEKCRELVSSGYVTSSMDSSDGLLISLYDIAQASNVRMSIHSLPYYPGLQQAASKHQLNAEDLVLAGGEEYESIFTVSPQGWDHVKNLMQKDLAYHRIGQVEDGEGVYLQEDGREERLERRGWEHLS
jgi:thiamine-monophosphate kinase